MVWYFIPVYTLHIYLGYITILKHTQHKRRIVGRQTEREEISKNCALRRTLTRWTKNIITSPSTVSGFLSSVLSVWPDDHLYEVVYIIITRSSSTSSITIFNIHTTSFTSASIYRKSRTQGVQMHYRSVIVNISKRDTHPSSMINIYLVTKSNM